MYVEVSQPVGQTMFLTETEVTELTGYARPSKQVSRLKVQRIPFHLDRSNRPKVARSVIEGSKTNSSTPSKTWSPSWAGNPA